MDNIAFIDQTEEELLAQWEPKVNSMLRTVSIIGLDREDMAQELRIAIVKSARRYNSEGTIAKFHTYLHVSMLNVIRSLIAKAQRRVVTTSLDKMVHGGPHGDPKTMADPKQSELFEAIDLVSVLKGHSLSPEELAFISLRTQNYRLKDISVLLGTNAIQLRDSIKKKMEQEPDE